MVRLQSVAFGPVSVIFLVLATRPLNTTENKKGTIKSYVDLEFWIGHKKFKEQFYETGLGKQKIILGFPWLNKYNPVIDWKKGEIKWQPLRID